MPRRIHPTFLLLGIACGVGTGVAMASNVSILIVWLGIALTTVALVEGVERAEQRRRR